MRIIFGFLIGISFCITCTFAYRTFWLRNYITQPISYESADTSKKGLVAAVVQIKSAHSNFEEKFSSINKRLDDFLVFGGVIITLLLAVTVSVYLKTEAEVSKHFKDSFEKYEIKVIETTNKIEQSAERILAYERLLTDKAKKTIQDNAPID